ncbi:hypothetical protein RhiirA5_417866 [Rhizophagus irregularis]|uniref:Uncharacterized protein n=1 Tax=Rhizophagus irregularis TaxID=588596 RepID=A0A2N0PLI7_9GLOM|nr:hypothetical protein RhiirA5_417866 [Rhizophagus irregularis]
MSRARTSSDIWWARILDRLDKLLHNYPKLPKEPFAENNLFHIVHYVPYVPGGNEIKETPDVSVSPDIAIVPRPATSTVIPHPPADTDVQYVEQLLLYFVYIGDFNDYEPRLGVREPVTGYFFRTMTAKLYRQGMLKQRWDFGNVRKNTRDPILNINDPTLCNAPNDPRFQIDISISDVFWDPHFPMKKKIL